MEVRLLELTTCLPRWNFRVLIFLEREYVIAVVLHNPQPSFPTKGEEVAKGLMHA